MSYTEKADVPFTIGSRVLIEGHKGVWIVYDHHGHSWPLGQNIDRVVLHHTNDFDRFVSTTWDQVKGVGK